MKTFGMFPLSLKPFVILYFCIKFSFASANFKMNSKSTTEKQLKFFNTFSNCLFYIINFEGYDINLSVVSQPVVLLRYNSLVESQVIPVEFLKRFRWNGVNYADSLFQESFKISWKNVQGEAIIYLHPPNEKKSAIMYQKEYWSKTSVLKDPFWLEFEERSEWEIELLNTTPKLSLLICKSGETGETCENDHHKNKWIDSVLGGDNGVRLVEIVLIMEISPNGEHLRMLCPYCNPCNPFQMVDVSNEWFDVASWLTGLSKNKRLDQKSLPPAINVVLFWSDLRMYRGIIENQGRRTQKALLEYIEKLDIKAHVDFLSHSFHIHVTRLLFQENITMRYIEQHFSNRFAWSEIFVEGCSKPVNVPAIFRPHLERNTQEHLASYQEIGLVFQKDQLRFVSCHKEAAHWITQLNELVFAFDTPTWILLVFTMVVVAHSLANVVSTQTNHTFWNVCFSLSGSLMDQSCSIFEQPGNGRILLYSLPFMFLVLSNVYKGDNITNLTTEPSLVQFDTFESLVEYKFDVRSRRAYVRDMEKYSSNEVTNLVQESGHEEFPYVSELWFKI